MYLCIRSIKFASFYDFDIKLPMSVIPKLNSCDHFFPAMLGDINLIFGMWMYNDKLQIKFTFHSGPMIFGRVMALGV